jgi:hypothetical protein
LFLFVLGKALVTDTGLLAFRDPSPGNSSLLDLGSSSVSEKIDDLENRSGLG